MPTEYQIVEVQSNVDRLSEHAVRSLLVKLVDRVAEGGADFMRTRVPVDTGRMLEHVGHHGAHDAGDLIEADVGIPRIPEADLAQAAKGARVPYFPGEQDSGDYPLFVARGTGIYGPAESPIYPRRAKALVFEGDGGTIFASSVRGQQPNPFLRETYDVIEYVLLPAYTELFKEHVQHLFADPSGGEL